MIVWGGILQGNPIFSTNTGGRYCAVGISPETPTITITDISLPEGNRGKRKFEFVVTLSSPLKSTVKVKYTTSDGTATVIGNDYLPKSRTAKIHRGDTTAIIKIKVRGDKLVEGNETFRVELSDAIRATISDAEGVGTILNDD
jgi:serralysin